MTPPKERKTAMVKATRISLLVLVLLSGVALLASAVGAASPRIDILRVEGAIVPAVASYIDRGITEAEENGSTAIIIELSTPGFWTQRYRS